MKIKFKSDLEVPGQKLQPILKFLEVKSRNLMPEIRDGIVKYSVIHHIIFNVIFSLIHQSHLTQQLLICFQMAPTFSEFKIYIRSSLFLVVAFQRACKTNL